MSRHSMAWALRSLALVLAGTLTGWAQPAEQIRIADRDPQGTGAAAQQHHAGADAGDQHQPEFRR